MGMRIPKATKRKDDDIGTKPLLVKADLHQKVKTMALLSGYSIQEYFDMLIRDIITDTYKEEFEKAVEDNGRNDRDEEEAE